MKRLTLVVVLAMVIVETGCLTQLTRKTLDKWEEMPLESARVEVVSAASDRVVLRWETTYQGDRARSGEIEIDPHLTDCGAIVRIIMRDAGEGARLAPQHVVDADGQRTGPLGPCDVVIFVTRLDQEVALEAANSERTLGHAQIEAPRNHVWLALVPLAAAADAAVVVSVIPLAALYGLGQSEAATTWSWSP